MIQRMKIQRKLFKQTVRFSIHIENYLYEVIKPFAAQILSQEINLYFVRLNEFRSLLGQDWNLYQLVVFNIIQNAIKYNQFQGDIVITMACRPTEDETMESYVLETQIIDSGIGISEERQKYLFVPMQELKTKQDFSKVKDFSIGLGLTCSQEITNALKGDIILKQSERGLTVFAFRVPVRLRTNDVKTLGQKFPIEKIMGNRTKDIKSKVMQYLKKNQGFSKKVVIDKSQLYNQKS